MGIIIPDYIFESMGIDLKNVYASTFGTEFFVRKTPQGLIITFTYFLWASHDARQSEKSCIGSVSRHIQYDETLPIMTQVYNAIKSDFVDSIDVLIDPVSNEPSSV
jgi:hypothetical protein